MARSVLLRTGFSVPTLAYGTALIPKEKLRECLRKAFDAGYRHIDTAQGYHNEGEIGEVLQECFAEGTLKRREVFVTTKLWMTHMGKDAVRGAVEGSLKKLQLEYVDLMLIHHPWGFKNRGDDTFYPKDEHGNYELETYDLTETWKALERMVPEGKIRSLGVSNFNSEQMERIYAAAIVAPVLNQVECHAYLPQKQLKQFCKERAVRIQAYCPLGSAGRPEHLKAQTSEPVLLDEPVLKAIGDKYGKTPAQVLIRNLLQREVLVAVKSASPDRIVQNFQVFDFTLSAEDMESIDRLSDTNHRYFWFSSLAGSHPDFPFNIPF